MLDWSYCPLKIEFEYGLLDGKIMQVQVKTDHQQCYLAPVIDGDKALATFETTLKLPDHIELIFSGKDNATDTKLDANGNIVKDLFVKIRTVKLDCFALSNKFMHTHLKLSTQDRIICTPYIGFNGSMTINLDKNNVFQQYYAFEG